MPFAWLDKLTGRVAALILLIVLALAGVAGWRMAQTHIAAQVYRHRLDALAEDYTELRDAYNQAVRRTAVTELIVEDGELTIRVRTIEGEQRRIATDLDPANEIYVDYVVIDGRLWIRRVFDDQTPPRRGVLIDPELADIDWEADNVGYGKAVYRHLPEGRWVVSVTGGGALGLARVEPDAAVELTPAPELRDYKPVEEEIARRQGELGVMDILRVIVGW
ncbi:MAG: hypothetical protein WD009_12990 [Phycisphaeraceae bacterium]